MREIKFKVWDKKYGHFNDIILELPRELNEDWTGLNYGDLVLLQYTGLKDKNGKEIYEGDVIDTDTMKAVVEYRVDSFMCGNTTLLFSIRGQVIGNVYEHPDLIK
jgi:hypothetical protein